MSRPNVRSGKPKAAPKQQQPRRPSARAVAAAMRTTDRAPLVLPASWWAPEVANNMSDYIKRQRECEQF